MTLHLIKMGYEHGDIPAMSTGRRIRLTSLASCAG